jgi:taurine dioxygenase
VGYHIVKVPERGGATSFSHAGAAYDALTADEQEAWGRRVSVNSNSGVVHPLVHEHPISGRKSVYLHLGMTGAVLEMAKGIDEVKSLSDLRLLDEGEMRGLFNRYNGLLEDFAHRVDHRYEEGDCIFIDNLAIAHRASPEALSAPETQGLRILHRTTVAGMIDFDPPPKFQLPPALDVSGRHPFGPGVFISGGIGFRWDPKIHMQN